MFYLAMSLLHGPLTRALDLAGLGLHRDTRKKKQGFHEGNNPTKKGF